MEPGAIVTNQAQASALAKDANMVVINRGALDALRQLGLEVEGVGATRIANGAIIVTQQGLLFVMSKITEAVGAGKVDLHKAAESLSKLATAITKCDKSIRLPVTRTAKLDVPARHDPGAPLIQLNQQTNVYETKAG